MKQTIEVEVGPEDDAGTCLVVLGDRRHERWDVNTVRAFGLTVPEPTTERVEYALYDRGFAVDEVLVAAHSLRVGDRIEWAPGDWREITQVSTDRDGDPFVIFDGEGRALNSFELVAVRRS